MHILIILFVFLSMPSWAQYYPEKTFPVLFKDVQLSGIFSDSKVFADAIPMKSEATIKKLYQKQKHKKEFDLKTFVLKNFIVPSTNDTALFSGGNSLPQHIEEVWTHLNRPPILKDSGSLLALPYPYIVPGGRFGELYYWDSYFTMLGLKVSGRNEAIKNMVQNFSYQIDRFGFIPNGNRSYYLTRSQPPFFSLMVDVLASLEGKKTYIEYLPQLLKEYEFWMNGTEKLHVENDSYRRVVLLKDHVVLNRYWDDANTPRAESFREDFLMGNQKNNSDFYRHIRAACESGWDFSSRWLKDSTLVSIHTTDILPVDLNCLLYHLESTIMQSYLSSEDKIHAQIYLHKAQARKTAILNYFWNDSLGFFTDFDFKIGKPTNVLTMAGIYPLFFQVADTKDAYRAINTLQEKFLVEGGLITTLKTTHQQWDAPNGWAPLQYIGYNAVKNYKRQNVADSIANRWMRTIHYSYDQTSRIMEKYNVLDPKFPGGGGEYPNQDGFGWTNGVYLYFKKESTGD